MLLRSSKRFIGLVFLSVTAFTTSYSAFAPAKPSLAVPFTVNDAGNKIDSNAGDGTRTTSGLVCTLRAAIMEVNATPGADLIDIVLGRHRRLGVIASAAVVISVYSNTT